MSKVKTLQEAIGKIKCGDMVSIGGNVLHRTPMAAVREMARQKKKHLKVVKTAGAMDVDLLCAAGCVATVDAGFISYETKYGLANHYRKAVQNGEVKGNEHACYTVMCALRAGSMNVPFMPVFGMMSGDLLEKADYFTVVEDPFTQQPVTLVKALAPNVAVIHVHECDALGNAVIHGAKFDDILLSRSADKVIITTEKIVSASKIRMNPLGVDIPGFLVDAVVHVPKGASPTSCHKVYDVDDKEIQAFFTEDLATYLQRHAARDHLSKRSGDR